MQATIHHTIKILPFNLTVHSLSLISEEILCVLWDTKAFIMLTACILHTTQLLFFSNTEVMHC
jgi:hypothetical protein